MSEESKKYNREQYNKSYYSEHREEILRKKRERYRTDPEYRARMIESSRGARGAVDRGPLQVEINGATFPARLVAEFAAGIGKSVPTVNHWQKSGTVPFTPFKDRRGRRLYTDGMVESVKAALAVKSRPSRGDVEFYSSVADGWAEQGVPVGKSSALTE